MICTLTTYDPTRYTPGPWDYDMAYIVAPHPDGRHPDIYIAEIAHSDDEGRIASPRQQDANRRLIAAAPELLEALDYLRDADEIEDCEGYTSTALVDVVGDDEYQQSRWTDFQPEQLRQAAPELLEAIPPLIALVHRLLPKHAQSDSTLDNLPEVIQARAALASATPTHQPPLCNCGEA